MAVATWDIQPDPAFWKKGLDVISGRFLVYGLDVIVVLLYVDDAVTVLLLVLADA